MLRFFFAMENLRALKTRGPLDTAAFTPATFSGRCKGVNTCDYSLSPAADIKTY